MITLKKNGGWDGYQAFATPLPNSKVDHLPVEISLTYPKEIYSLHLALEAIFPDNLEHDTERLRQKILCPFEFDTNHPYSARSESLIKKIEAWAEENEIRLFTRGYIRGNRWLDENTEKRFNTLHWRAPDEETAFYIALIWSGKE